MDLDCLSDSPPLMHWFGACMHTNTCFTPICSLHFYNPKQIEVSKLSTCRSVNRQSRMQQNMGRTSVVGTNEMSEYSEKTRVRLHELLNKGKHVEATSKRVDISKLPDYFDQIRFNRAQKITNKYYSSLSLASTTGLILLVQIESILIPLLRTGKSRTVPDLFDRYVATAKYIRKCYETNFYDSKSEGWRYVVGVRAMHTRIHSIMNESTGVEGADSGDEKPAHLWVNQYDMALTQFAFIGLFLLKPNKCGAYNVTREELSDITYYWCLISYYFGIEDRFNIFIDYDDLDQQLNLMQALYGHQKTLLAENRPEVGLEMAKGIMLAFEDLTTELSFNILDHWWHPEVSISGRTNLERYTLSDRWKLISFHFIIGFLMRIESLRSSITYLYKRKFDKFCESGEKTKLKLSKKYGHLVFDSEH